MESDRKRSAMEIVELGYGPGAHDVYDSRSFFFSLRDAIAEEYRDTGQCEYMDSLCADSNDMDVLEAVVLRDYIEFFTRGKRAPDDPPHVPYLFTQGKHSSRQIPVPWQKLYVNYARVRQNEKRFGQILSEVKQSLPLLRSCLQLQGRLENQTAAVQALKEEKAARATRVQTAEPAEPDSEEKPDSLWETQKEWLRKLERTETEYVVPEPEEDVSSDRKAPEPKPEPVRQAPAEPESAAQEPVEPESVTLEDSELEKDTEPGNAEPRDATEEEAPRPRKRTVPDWLIQLERTEVEYQVPEQEDLDAPQKTEDREPDASGELPEEEAGTETGAETSETAEEETEAEAADTGAETSEDSAEAPEETAMHDSRPADSDSRREPVPSYREPAPSALEREFLRGLQPESDEPTVVFPPQPQPAPEPQETPEQQAQRAQQEKESFRQALTEILAETRADSLSFDREIMTAQEKLHDNMVDVTSRLLADWRAELKSTVDHLSGMQDQFYSRLRTWQADLYPRELEPLSICYQELYLIVYQTLPLETGLNTEDLQKLQKKLITFLQKFEKALRGVGLSPFFPEPGTPFDELCHEPLTPLCADDPIDLVVDRCVRPGILHHISAGEDDVEIVEQAVVALRQVEP